MTKATVTVDRHARRRSRWVCRSQEISGAGIGRWVGLRNDLTVNRPGATDVSPLVARNANVAQFPGNSGNIAHLS